MERLGALLAKLVSTPALIFLQGDLGMGKTTLARGLLRSRGHTGTVKSPTYTLVEPYELEGETLYHFDLYRLCDPEELEYMGIRDYLDRSLVLIEWPEKGAGALPEPELTLTLEKQGSGRSGTFQGSPALLQQISAAWTAEGRY